MTSINCYFEVIGHGFDPAVLTDALGIEPTVMWRTGERTRRSGRPYQHDGWSLRREKLVSLDLQEVVLPILNRLLPVAETLVEVCSRHNLEVVLACAIYIEGDQMPAISLDNETIRMLNALGASVDIDILDLRAN